MRDHAASSKKRATVLLALCLSGLISGCGVKGVPLAPLTPRQADAQAAAQAKRNSAPSPTPSPSPTAKR